MRVPEALAGLGWELPSNYLGLEPEQSAFGSARVVVLPVPYEATVSYGGGTRGGPAAILQASRYIELYDHELGVEPASVGIATLPALQLTGAGPGEAVAELRAAYDRVLAAAEGKFVVVLGGEHSLSSAPILAWADRLGGERLSVLQLDAHTDLRPSYEGTEYSHASVMHRVHERVDIVAVGIRALTREERDLADRTGTIRIHYADDIHGPDTRWIDDVVAELGEHVYLTFDVDAFDPSLVPGTGTPEPGGLTWYPVLELLRRVCQERTVVAADFVELAPIAGHAAADFLVAKLIYKLIGYRFFGRQAR